MVFLLVVAAASILSSLWVQICAGLVVVIVAAATSAFFARTFKNRETRKDDDRSTRELVTEMHVALVGAEKTPLNPNPAPGALKVIADVAERTTRIEHTLFTNGDRNNTILDRLSRIEGAATRVEGRQGTLEDERQVRDAPQ